MKAPKAAPQPAPPDPRLTAQAQSSGNTGTAIAGQTLAMVDQYTPEGSLVYNQIGSTGVPDGFGGNNEIPRFSATQTLSPFQSNLNAVSNETDLSLAQTGRDQAARIGSLLNAPVSLNGLPEAPSTVGSAGSPAMGFAGAGPVQRSLSAGTGRIPSTFNEVGGVTRSIGDSGDIAGTFGDAGGVRRSIGDSGDIKSSFADVGGPRRTVGPTDFSGDRQRVEEALMSRINPDLQRDRTALETQLVNAGYRRGSESWDRAMDQSGRAANDARMGAVLAGGQEQTRMAGLEFGKFDRENAAQSQEFGQARDRAGFANSAEAQRYAEMAGRAGFENSAQAQEFGQQRDRGTFANSAEAQRFGEMSARAGFENSAQQQDYGQTKDRATFESDAQAREFEQGVARMAAENEAQGQEFGQNQAGATFGNQAQQQGYNQNLSTANYEGANRDRVLRELFAQRNQPINEITALMSGSQVQQPNFTTTPQTPVAGVDYTGVVNNNYNQQMQYATQANAQRIASQNAMMGGLFGAAGTAAYGAMRFSDRRLKFDVTRIGTGALGLPLYTFRYIWGEPGVGYMADEVEAVMPAAVVVTPSGFSAVDYSLLGEG